MKIFPILSAALACGLIASSCTVKNTTLSRPVSSVPSENSSAISQLSSQNSSEISPETMVSSMIAAFYAASSAADHQTPSAPASCVITSSASSDSTSVTYDSVSAVPLPKSIIDGMKNPKSLTLCGFAACLRDVPAKNEDKTAAEVQHMLASAAPYSGMVPRSPKCKITSMDYLGPCFLTVQTQDGHKVQVEPYAYTTFTAASLPPGEFGGSFEVHYVPDLLEITVDNKTSYFTAHDLYTWLQSKQCDSDFDLDYKEKISVSAAPYKGK